MFSALQLLQGVTNDENYICTTEKKLKYKMTGQGLQKILHGCENSNIPCRPLSTENNMT